MKGVETAFPAASHDMIEQMAHRMYKEIYISFGRWPVMQFTYPIWMRPLADSTQKDRKKKGYTKNRPLDRDGFLRDTVEKRVNKSAGWAVIGSPYKMMLYNEMGTVSGGPGNKRGTIAGRYYIPPRPIFGKAVMESQQWLQRSGAEVFGNFLRTRI